MAATRTAGKSSTRKSTSPRKAAQPRKRAASRTTAAASTEEVSSPDEAGAVAVSEAEGEPNAPAEAKDDPQAKDKPNPSAPYKEGTPLFIWDAEDGSGHIRFPHFATVDVDKAFLWIVSHQPEVVQGFRWMDRAGIPEDIQWRVVNLPDEEYKRLFEAWFNGVEATVGESQRSPEPSANTGTQ